MARSKKQKRKRKKKSAPGPSEKRCGLCGKKGNLTRTECCGQWICDDYDQYVPFSYARNSCSRNHGNFTLCAHHDMEDHDGSWQTCAVCRSEYEAEFYGWLGTNEYNFVKLLNPPPYEPKYCADCGRRIVLATDGYTMSGKGEYRCESCMHRAVPELSGLSPAFAPPAEEDLTERAHIHVLGPPGSGKTWFIERVLETNRKRRILAARFRADSTVDDVQLEVDGNHETRAYAAAGCCEEMLYSYCSGVPTEIGPMVFVRDLFSEDLHGIVVEADEHPFYQAELTVFVTWPLPEGEDLYSHRYVADVDLTREQFELLRRRGGLPREAIEWLDEELGDREGVTLGSTRWALRDSHRWLAMAGLVLINIESEAERPAAERMAAAIERMKTDPELKAQIFGGIERPRTMTVRIVNLAEPRDKELKRAIETVKRKMPSDYARPRVCLQRPARRGQPRRVCSFHVAEVGFGRSGWREIHMPEDATFWELHVAVSGAMEGTTEHLHRFEIYIDDDEPPMLIGELADDDETVIASWSTPVRAILTEEGMEAAWYAGEEPELCCTVLFAETLPAEPGESYPLVAEGEDEDDEDGVPFEPEYCVLEDPVVVLQELFSEEE